MKVEREWLLHKETTLNMFQDYPDVVNVAQLQKMLGGIGRNSAYKFVYVGVILQYEPGTFYRADAKILQARRTI